MPGNASDKALVTLGGLAIITIPFLVAAGCVGVVIEGIAAVIIGAAHHRPHPSPSDGTSCESPSGVADQIDAVGDSRTDVGE